MSSTESEDTELGFNHGAQCFIRALSMEHSAAAEAEQQRCVADLHHQATWAGHKEKQGQVRQHNLPSLTGHITAGICAATSNLASAQPACCWYGPPLCVPSCHSTTPKNGWEASTP